MPPETLYPHEKVLAWFDRHFLAVVCVFTLIVMFTAAYAASKVVGVFLGVVQPMQPYNCCDMGPPP